MSKIYGRIRIEFGKMIKGMEAFKAAMEQARQAAKDLGTRRGPTSGQLQSATGYSGW